MLKKIGSFFKSNPEYKQIKTTNETTKKNVKTKERYVNMLYIYFFNEDDYIKLRKDCPYLPEILQTITVCNNCDDKIHKEIKDISYVRYSTKNGLQKIQKLNDLQKLIYLQKLNDLQKLLIDLQKIQKLSGLQKNNEINEIQKEINEIQKKNYDIKKIKSLYTEKFNLSTKYANYEILQRDIINCLKELNKLYSLLNTAMYFITIEEFKKEESSFKISSLFSKDKNIAKFSKNADGIVNMSGIISLEKLNELKKSKKENTQNKISKENLNKLYYNRLDKNNTESLIILNPIYNRLNSITVNNLTKNNLIQIKKIKEKKEKKEMYDLFNIFLSESEIDIIIKAYNKQTLRNAIENKILNWKILNNLSNVNYSILEEYIRIIYNIINDNHSNDEILTKLQNDIRIVNIEKHIHKKNENNRISKEIYNSRIEHEKMIYIYFLEKNVLQNYLELNKLNVQNCNELICNSKFLKNIEGKSFFKYSNKNGFEITPFFTSIIEKSKEDILHLIESFKYMIVTLNAARNNGMDMKLTIKFIQNFMLKSIYKSSPLFLINYNNEIIEAMKYILINLTKENYHDLIISHIGKLNNSFKLMCDKLKNDINKLMQYKLNFNKTKITTNIYDCLNKINDFFYNIDVSIFIDDNKIKIIKLVGENKLKNTISHVINKGLIIKPRLIRSKNIIMIKYNRILEKINNLLKNKKDNTLNEYKKYIETINIDKIRQNNNLKNTFLNKINEIENYVDNLTPN